MATALRDDELWRLVEPLWPARRRRFHHPGMKRLDDRRARTRQLALEVRRCRVLAESRHAFPSPGSTCTSRPTAEARRYASSRVRLASFVDATGARCAGVGAVLTLRRWARQVRPLRSELPLAWHRLRSCSARARHRRRDRPRPRALPALHRNVRRPCEVRRREGLGHRDRRGLFLVSGFVLQLLPHVGVGPDGTNARCGSQGSRIPTGRRARSGALPRPSSERAPRSAEAEGRGLDGPRSRAARRASSALPSSPS